LKAIDLVLVERCQSPKRTRAIDLERMRGKQSATLGEITLEEREGIRQELLKVREPESI
jgi:hypothetical protein